MARVQTVRTARVLAATSQASSRPRPTLLCVPQPVRRIAREVRHRLARETPGSSGVTIHLPYDLESKPRYGYGQPPHPRLEALIERRRPSILELLRDFMAFAPDWRRIRVEAGTATGPNWSNGWFQGLDAAVLYGMLARHNPARLLEVGSGYSTMFARRAIDDHRLRTTLTSIDPEPRADIDTLCHRVVRSPLEATDLTIFDELEPGDFCFIDSSHHSFMNSDVSVAFLDVLPRLRAGVIVHFHDIFLPYDYPPEWGDRFYNEHYLLAATLLAGDRLEIVFPCQWALLDTEGQVAVQPLRDFLLPHDAPLAGSSFWSSVNGR